MQTAQLLVGLDVGGTKTAALLVNASGSVLGQATVPTRTATPDELLDSISQAIHLVLAQAQVTPPQIQMNGLAEERRSHALPGAQDRRQAWPGPSP